MLLHQVCTKLYHVCGNLASYCKLNFSVSNNLKEEKIILTSACKTVFRIYASLVLFNNISWI